MINLLLKPQKGFMTVVTYKKKSLEICSSRDLAFFNILLLKLLMYAWIEVCKSDTTIRYRNM